MKLTANQLFIWKDLMTPRGRRLAFWTLGLLTLVELIGLMAPYGLGTITAGISTQNQKLIWYGLTIYIGLECVMHGLHWGLFRVRERMVQENFWSLRHSLSRLFVGLTLGQLTNNKETIDGSGVESLYGKVVNVHDQNLFNVIPNLISISFGAVVCLVIEPLVGIAVVVYVITVRWWSRMQNRYIITSMEPIDSEFRRWRRWVCERWESVSLLKWNGTEARFLNDLHQQVQPTLKRDDYVWRVRFASMITQRRFVETTAMAIFAYWLSQLSIVREQFNTAEFVWLLLVLQQMLMRLRDISDAERSINHDDASITSYRERLQEVPHFDRSVGEVFEDTMISIRLDDVSLHLGETRREILRNVSLSIKPGERVAIVGPSGAGKSSLIDVILRAFDPTKGQVLVNETPLTTYAPDSLKRRVGFIPQDMTVFEGTIRTNILEGISHLDWNDTFRTDDELVWTAVRRAGLTDVHFEAGLETEVGYRGVQLSGGQRQRLAIAAALVKNPLLVIGDEMTSALDSVSEAHVLTELETTLSRDTTLIMIAHRLSTLRSCGKVVFVEPCNTCTTETNVRVYSTFEAAFAGEPIFQEMARAQGFNPSTLAS